MKLIVSILFVSSLFGFNLKEIKQIYYQSYNYEKMGDYQDAIKVLIPLYKIYKHGYTLNLRLGYLFELQKDYANAIKHYKIALLSLPYSFEVRLALMRVNLELENYDEVIKLGDILIKKDYYNFYGNYYIIKALEGKKEYKTDVSFIKKMLSIYPTSILYLQTLGEVYVKEGYKKQAKDIFENLLILDPNNVVAKQFLYK